MLKKSSDCFSAIRLHGAPAKEAAQEQLELFGKETACTVCLVNT
jgi:hypothetical protein